MHKCRLWKCLDCIEICQDKDDKTKGRYVCFRRYYDMFGNSCLFDNLAVEITTKQKIDFISFMQNLLYLWKFELCRSFFSTEFATKR